MRSKTPALVMVVFLLTLSLAKPAFSLDSSPFFRPLDVQTPTINPTISIPECLALRDDAVARAVSRCSANAAAAQAIAQAAADAQLAQAKADAAAELAAAETRWREELIKAVRAAEKTAATDKALAIAQLTASHAAEMNAMNAAIEGKNREIAQLTAAGTDALKAAEDAAAAKEQDLLRAHCFEPQETFCAEVELDDVWIAQYCNGHAESLRCQARVEQAYNDMRAAIEAAGFPTGTEQIKFCRMHAEIPACSNTSNPHP